MNREKCPLNFNCDYCKWDVYTSEGYKCALVIIAEAAAKAGEHHE